LTDWFTISALWGENNYNRYYTSTVDTPVLQDRTSGTTITTGNNVIGNFAFNQDRRESTRIDADFYFDLGGEHHIRAGWDEEKLTAQEATRYSGNIWERFETRGSSSTGLAVRVRQYWNTGDFSTKQGAYYIQDSWQAMDNLLLSVGFRNETFTNRNAAGDIFVESKDQQAWRFGFSWDPANDGQNRVYGSWGRYFLPIATNTNVRMAGAEQYLQQYYEVPADWDTSVPFIGGVSLIAPVDFSVVGPAGTNQLFTTDSAGNPLVANTGVTVFGDGEQTETYEATDQNLKPMFQDEWIIGGEHDFGNGWSIGARFVHRKLGRLIEDIAIDAGVPIWAAANGYDAVAAASTWSGFHQYVLTNPGGTVTVATGDLLNLDGTSPGIVTMTLTPDMLPYPEGRRSYNAIDLTFSREWDGKWALDGSYTWSKSYGNTEGGAKSDNGQTDSGLTTDFDQPGFTDGAYGPLPGDRRHRFKLWGSYQVNDWLTIGANVRVESPRKFGCIGEHPTDLFAWYYGASSWYCGGQLTPRGSQLEGAWTRTLDLTFSFAPKISDDMPGDLTLRVDVFNVFNSAAVQDLNEFGEFGFTSNLVFGGTTLADVNPNYGRPLGFTPPRRVRLSASYKF